MKFPLFAFALLVTGSASALDHTYCGRDVSRRTFDFGAPLSFVVLEAFSGDFTETLTLQGRNPAVTRQLDALQVPLAAGQVLCVTSVEEPRDAGVLGTALSIDSLRLVDENGDDLQ